MPKLEKQQLIQQGLLNMMEKRDLSQNDLARMSDVSAANISHILNGRADKPISEEIWNRAAALLGDTSGWRLLKTANFASVQAACQRAQADCSLGYVLGQAGYGKTAALRNYCQNRPNVYYTEFWGSFSRREFFLTVARALAVDTGKRPTLAYLIQRCADKLNASTGSLLIIDEASNMQPEKLNYVRELRERTQYNAGIVLAGVPYFLKRLHRQAEREREGIPEFMSRLGDGVELTAPTTQELLAVARANGMSEADAKAALKAGGPLPEYRALGHWIRNHQRAASEAAETTSPA